MKIEAKDPNDYASKVQDKHKEAFAELRKVVKKNLPKGFEECMNYGMIGYVVPHKLYPDGYHCKPELPLPFMNIAAQKNFIGFYHMGIYSDPDLMKWFQEEYTKRVPGKLDMGKSCIRLKKMDQIPYELFGELVKKVKPEEWIATYETAYKQNLKKK